MKYTFAFLENDFAPGFIGRVKLLVITRAFRFDRFCLFWNFKWEPCIQLICWLEKGKQNVRAEVGSFVIEYF